MGDRGGGRESKGTSLKNSKKNPGSTAAKVKKEARAGPARLKSEPPPLPADGGRFIDCGAALLSRQFDRDRDRVIQRARDEGQCSSVIMWFSDIEKQQTLADLAKSFPGICYFTSGIHPDNIDRTNMKSHREWLERIEELGRRPECLAIITGLNLSREVGTHFAQESLLKSSCEVADRLELPIVLYCPDISSLERAVENLREIGWIADSYDNGAAKNDKRSSSSFSGGGCDGGGVDSSVTEGAPPTFFIRKVIIHDIVTVCGGNPEKIPYLVDAGLYCIVSAAGITELSNAELRTNALECIRRIPRNRLLLGSDSPWKTPQNHPDEYLRTLRNEPANCPYVVSALSQGLAISLREMEELLKNNAWRAYGFDNIESQIAISTPAIPQTSGKVEAPPPGNKSGVAATISSGAVSSSSSTTSLVSENSSEPAVGLTASIRVKKMGDLSSDSVFEKANDGDVDAPPAVYYSCHKCRHFLFEAADVYTHGIDAFKTVFKAGEKGLCQSTIFMLCADEKGRIISRPGMGIPNTNVECKGCGQKLGKYNPGDSPCACGAMVRGPSIRISSPKVDFNDKTLETQELIARSKIEVVVAIRQEQLLQEENDLKEEEGRISRKEKKKKKETHSRGGGNFSEFRNKSFQPNQSRKVVALTEEQHREMAVRDVKMKEDLLKKKKNQVTMQNLEKNRNKNSNSNSNSSNNVDGDDNGCSDSSEGTSSIVEDELDFDDEDFDDEE